MSGYADWPRADLMRFVAQLSDSIRVCERTHQGCDCSRIQRRHLAAAIAALSPQPTEVVS